MNVRVALEQARAEQALIAEARKAAWETDPGNLRIAHNIFNAYGYHEVFKRWERAGDKVRQLEAELARLEVA